MRSFRLLATVCVVVAALAVLPACSGGGSDVTIGSGTITITAFAPNPVPGGLPTPFTITGLDFETVTGTTAIVTFRALGGATPFAGGTSDTAEVIGSVTSDTTITGTTPSAVVCGVASILFNVQVTLESGVQSNVFDAGGTLSFSAPTISVGGVSPNPIPSEIPTTITITGTGYGPVGSVVTVRFISDGVPPAAPLFGDASEVETTATGAVSTANTVITVVAPLAAVCGVASRTASIQVTLDNGSCTAISSGALTYTAPTIVSTNAPSVPCLEPGGFTITGTNFGHPVGAQIQLTFTETPGGANPLFESGTQTTTIVTGTIASSTTITGTYPAATVCGVATRTATVRATFPAGSCADSPAAFVTFRAPQLTSITTAFAGNGLRETEPTAYTLTGTDLLFPVASFPVLAHFLGGGTIYQPDSSGAGTAAFDDAPAVIVGATSAVGSSPVIARTTTPPVGTTVQLVYPDGTCTNALAVTWIPPPSITDVATNLLVREYGSAPGNRSFLSHTETYMTITGTNFTNPGATVLVYRQAGGPASPIGTGALTGPTPTGTTTIAGGSPTDSTLMVDEQAEIRVTNPDGQSGTYTDPSFVFRVRGHLQNTNVSLQGGGNSEMEAAIDPTNPRNLATMGHGNNGPGDMRFAYSTDAGRTWTQTDIGAAQDGGSAGQDRIDPRCAYDRFGNLYVCYFTRGPAPARTLYVLQSIDKGVTWSTVQVVPAPAATIDKQWLVTGVNAANPAEEAIYVGWDDATSGGILASGATCTGAGAAVSAFSAPIQIIDLPVPGAPGNQYSNACVGPNGDLHVTWMSFSGAPANGEGPSLLAYDRCPGGIAAGVFVGAFGADVIVNVTNFGDFDSIPAQPVRESYAMPEVAAVLVGPSAGRVCIVYGVENPDESNDTDIVCQFTDNGGLTFSAQIPVNDDGTATAQWQASVRADRATGTLASAWYDSRQDIVNNRLIRMWASVTYDGGMTWQANMQLADGQSDQANLGGDPNEFLDYEGLAIHGDTIYSAWADNSNSTGDNPSGTGATENYVTRYQFR